MTRIVLVMAAVMLFSLAAQAAEVLFSEDFDAGAQERWKIPSDLLASEAERGQVLHVSVPPERAEAGRTLSIPLPIEKLRGARVTVGADVRIGNLSKKPNAWNGVKVMTIVKVGDATDYPQAQTPEVATPWRRYAGTIVVPQDATSATLVLGLERVSGEAWFDNVTVTLRRRLVNVPAAAPDKPIYRGHDLPRLRGAMTGHNLKEDDIRHFGQEWNGNLFRWQFFESARQDRPLDKYDEWLDEQIKRLDEALPLCRKYGIMIVVDIHSPPGGEAFEAGYITAKGDIFRKPEAQKKFIEVWQRLAKHYKGEPAIWGFDLVNEPDDTMVSEDCLEWNELALVAARAIHAIDPERTIIVEPNGWGGPGAFASFVPLDEPRVVYSYHMYTPHQFTHQGVHGNPTGIVYPGEIGGKKWDKQALDEAMKPAHDFAKKYRVHMYVGEFSAIRNAPENSAPRYLADVISLFEQHGYDWTYHAYREWAGWSVEHTGPLNAPKLAETPTDAEKVLVEWYQKNQKPAFTGK